MKKLLTILSLQVCLLLSCDSTLPDDPIPYVSFQNIEINLTNLQYQDLNTKGYMKIDGGVKGIIIYKDPFESKYSAYERNCSYEPYSDCATVEIDDSGLFMIDPCCNSQFNFENGFPIGGPANAPLRKYRTILNGNFLVITDEPL